MEMVLLLLALLGGYHFGLTLPPGRPKTVATVVYLIFALAFIATLISTSNSVIDYLVVAVGGIFIGFMGAHLIHSSPSRAHKEAQAIVAGITHHILEGKGVDESVEISLRELELHKLRELQLETLNLIDHGQPAHVALSHIAQQSGSPIWQELASAIVDAADELGEDNGYQY